MTTHQAEQAAAERVAAYVKEREAERRRAEARKAARTGPDAAEIAELEQRWEQLHQDRLAVMQDALREMRTLDAEEAAAFDQLTIERDELAHRIASLEAKHRPST